MKRWLRGSMPLLAVWSLNLGSAFAHPSQTSISHSIEQVVQKPFVKNVAQTSEPGTSVGTALPLLGLGEQTVSITDQKYSIYSIQLNANQTYVLYPTDVESQGLVLENQNGVILGSVGSSQTNPCVYTPLVTSTYYIKVYGAASTRTIRVLDGGTFANAYPISSLKYGSASLKYSLPSNSTAYYTVSLNQGETYTFTANGPSAIGGIRLYDSNQNEIAGSSVSPLTFTAGSTGTYYIAVDTGTASGVYSVSVGEQGISIPTAFWLSGFGQQTVTITDLHFSYYGIFLTANETYSFYPTDQQSQGLTLQTSSGAYVGPVGSSSSHPCTYTPSTSGTYYLKVWGTGSTRTIDVSDGTGPANPQPMNPIANGTTGVSSTIPAGGTSYDSVSFKAGQTYTVTVNSQSPVSGITVYDNHQNVVNSSNGSSLSVTPTATGTYEIAVDSSTTGGTYTVQISESGTSIPTAFSLPGLGQQTVNITDQHYSYYAVSLLANQTYSFYPTDIESQGLELLDSNGVPLSTVGSSSSFPCTYTPSTSGTYYLKVWGTRPTRTIQVLDGTDVPSAHVMSSLRGGSTSLTCSIPSNSDAYDSVNLNSGQTYTVTVSGPNAPIETTVYDSNQNALDTSTTSSFVFAPPTSGRYYICVSTGAASGPYTVSVVENGSSIATAMTLSGTGQQTLNITDQHYAYYAITLVANQNYVIYPTKAQAQGLILEDGNGVILGTVGTSQNYPCSLFVPSASGTYYLQVWSTTATRTIDVMDGTSVADAYGLPSFRGVASGTYFMPASALQFYSVSLTSGKTYTVSVNGPAVSGVTVYDGNQNQIVSTLGSTLTLTPSASGLYYIMVGSGTNGGNYTITVK